jgi:preprotein translocase subunit SecF
MFVIRNKTAFLSLAGILVGVSIAAVLFLGLNLGIDFTGGTLVEVTYPDGRPTMAELQTLLKEDLEESFVLRPTGETGYFLRTKELTEAERPALFALLSFEGERRVVEERFTSIGPTVGSELKQKALIALLLVVGAIILFVAFSFRKVSYPVSSWKYGIVAVITLLHDVALPIGLFVILGKAVGVEIDILFITALLAILGYSVNDTIVVFDRIRENLQIDRTSGRTRPFGEVVGESLKQTYVRSINTSLTTLLVLLLLFFVGGEPTRYFSLALLTGVIAGTYSSIFLASPLLVAFEKLKKG